jgi:hypothetical protein
MFYGKTPLAAYTYSHSMVPPAHRNIGAYTTDIGASPEAGQVNLL